MIRNIVFDLGNVLISFRPAEYLKRNNYPEKTRQRILNDIFLSPEWLMLDDGKISPEEAVDSIARKSSLKREEIALVFNKRTEIMFPIERNARLLPGLKKRGFRLYYLSNFPLDIFDEIKNSYLFFKYFDGGIISSEVKYSKPGIEIYKIFFEKYKLKPEESLFIDDIEANVRSAELIGMKCIHLSCTDSLENRLPEYLSLNVV
jgi:putative hydrolase of the HAD superfamily